ncbi:MAG: hypothetical protein ACE5HX_14630 [bacterium]
MNSKKAYKLFCDPLNRQLIRDQIAGFKKMNELVRKEQREKLPKMTTEESKKIYMELLQIWEHSQKQNPEMGNLDRLRSQELIKQRDLFAKIASGLSKKC